MSGASSGIEWRRVAERLRIVRARAGERARRGAVAAEAAVIGIVSVNVSRVWATDGDHDIIENGDRISRQNLHAVAAECDV